MSVTSGFFDAMMQGGNPDRMYDSTNFVDYFRHIIDSGVAVGGNPNSMKVSISGNNAIVAAGYLFIDGYWLKNDADYTISLSSATVGNYVILARLSKANRSIVLRYEEAAESYADCLVLATLSKSAAGSLGSLVDTRNNSTLCGTIKSLGSLNDAVDTALNNISDLSAQIAVFQTTLDNQALAITSKFNEVDAVKTQKVAEANALLASTDSPAVGAVQYSIQSLGNKWLKCDGSYVDGTVYPALVTLLHISDYPLPSPSSESLGTGSSQHTSNMLLIDGCIFFYDVKNRDLKKLDLSTATISSITLSGTISSLNDYDDVQMTILDGGRLAMSQSSLNYIVQSTQVLDRNTASLSFATVYLGTSDSTVYQGVKGNSATGSNQTLRRYTRLSYAEGYGYTLGYAYISPTSTGNDSVIVCPYAYSAVFGVLPKLGCSSKFRNEAFAIKFETITVNNELCHRMTMLNWSSSATYLVKVSEDTVFPENSVVLTENIPVQCSDKAMYGALIDNAKKLILYVTSLSQFQLYKKEFNFTLPSHARVFLDAACYLDDKGLFIMFIGTGFFFAYDILDEGTYGYYDTTELIGTQLSNCYLQYDSITKKLLLIAKNGSSVLQLYTFDITTWSSSDTGAYLPTIHNGSINGYIKALE